MTKKNGRKQKKNVSFDNSLAQYLNKISKYRILPKNETLELFRRYREDGDMRARDLLVEHNLRYVVMIAKKYYWSDVPIEDRISEGNIGLYKAIDKYNTDMNVPFLSYATWWIKDSIQDLLEKKSKAMLDIEGKEDKYCEVFHAGEKINEEFERKLDEIQEKQASVNELLNCLQERELKIITLFFGLNGGREMTLDEVGNEMNLTIERVRQIKDRAMMKIKSNALSLPEKEFEYLKKLC